MMATATLLQLTVDLAEFSRAYSIVSDVIGGKPALPVLKSVHVRVQDGTATLTATGPAASAILTIPVESDDDGVFLLSPTTKDILGTLKNEKGQLSLELDGSNLKFRYGTKRKGESTVTTDDPVLFPLPVEPDDSLAIEIQPADLIRGIRRSIVAAEKESDDIGKLSLRGVALIWRDKELEFVATDGRRLSFQPIPALAHVDHDGKTRIIPSSLAQYVIRSLTDEPVHVSFEADRSIRFSQGSLTVMGRLVEGRFPGYQALLAMQSTRVFRLNAGDLLALVERARPVNTGESCSVKLRFADGELTVSTPASPVSHGSNSVPIFESGDPVEFTAPGTHFEELCKVMGEVDFEFGYVGSTQPAVIRYDGMQHFIMPMVATKGA